MFSGLEWSSDQSVVDIWCGHAAMSTPTSQARGPLTAPAEPSGLGKGLAESSGVSMEAVECGDPATWYISAHNPRGPGAAAVDEGAGSTSFQTLKAARRCAAKARLEHWRATAAPERQQEVCEDEGQEDAKASTRSVFVDAACLERPASEQADEAGQAGVPGSRSGDRTGQAGAGLPGHAHRTSTAESRRPSSSPRVAEAEAMGRVESTFIPAPCVPGPAQARPAGGTGRGKPAKQAAPAPESDPSPGLPKPPSRASRPEHDLAVQTAIEVCGPQLHRGGGGAGGVQAALAVPWCRSSSFKQTAAGLPVVGLAWHTLQGTGFGPTHRPRFA